MPRVTGLGHVGLFVRDLDTMVEFYSNFLGLTITDRAGSGGMVFLSAHPDSEHHELVLSKSATRHSDPQQLSFTVSSIADLKVFYQQIVERGYTIDHLSNHGNALGCYFLDPEGNRVEVYWHTNKAVQQPHTDPLDLTLSETELLEDLARFPDAALPSD